MSTIVGVMDRAGFEANTDNLVFVDPEREQLLWIPRDLWSPVVGDRINAAYRSGGHALLIAALAEHGLEARYSLVIARNATETALANVSVLVPVPAPMSFDYPLTPTARIEDGRKRVTFAPPATILRGERVHQWIGARGGTDLHRIERQKVFIRRLLEQHFEFGAVLAQPDNYRCTDDAACADLAGVRHTWRFATLGPLDPAVIGGRQVLVPRVHEDAAGAPR